jgi:hypothetical protein
MLRTCTGKRLLQRPAARPRSLAEAKASGSKAFFFEKKKQKTFDYVSFGPSG